MKKILTIFMLFTFVSPVFSDTSFKLIEINKIKPNNNVVQYKKNTNTVSVPKNTEVILSLKRKKSQRTISDEMTLKAIIKKDVYVDGVLVFAKGDEAKIHVIENDKAKFFCKGGTLVLDGAWAYDASGRKRDLSMYKKFKGEDAPAIAKILIFKKGQNVMIYPHDIFKTTTTETFKF